jgi:hypothetical protein
MAFKFETNDAEGAPFELAPGFPFRTFWAVEEGETVAFEVSHPWTALDTYGEADLARFTITKTEVADPPPPVPDSVSIMRAQLVLDAAGQLDAVDAYMADPATPRAHKIIYAKTDKIWRDSEVLAVIAAVLGYDDDQLDDLFRAADALTL